MGVHDRLDMEWYVHPVRVRAASALKMSQTLGINALKVVQIRTLPKGSPTRHPEAIFQAHSMSFLRFLSSKTP